MSAPPLTCPDAAAEALASLLADAVSVLGFTGAGISTECGVPDFRSPGSPWLQNKPIPYPAFVASAEARREAWRRKFAMDDHYSDARPGRGHHVLAAMVARGVMPAIITQNIDGLHQAAGVPAERVIEIHGNGTYAACLDCGTRHELPPVRAHFEQTGDAPACLACGGLIKSATISFGQAMPEGAMQRAADLARRCEVFLAIGSSLVVFPAATLPLVAERSGADLVIINGEPTELDGDARLVIRADIGTVLASTAANLGWNEAVFTSRNRPQWYG
jgi:NAD-dependent deacetylase